ncbi:MAG: hypothetical protein HDQ97_00160 [Lachnospiraceae bacterium]|nr:hypothetical protein [Lachnospiraceae bacterium]
MKQRMTLKEFEHVCDVLSRMSQQELCEVYWVIQSDCWDDRLGEKPNNFDNLPLCANKWYQRLLGIKSKDYYLNPYHCGICALVSHDILYDFYNTHIAEATSSQIQAARENRKKEKEIIEKNRKVHDRLISWGFIK